MLLPTDFRRAAFEEVHNLAHPGVRATKRMMSRRFLWSGMASNIAAWVSSCLACQRSKVYRHSKSSIKEIAVPVRRFDHLHVDLVGPLQHSAGSSYLLTIIDRRTRWPEAVPLTEMSADGCISALKLHWIARFGVPATITTDQGTQFTSSAWKSTMTALGIEHICTTPYHPQSNGMVERFHRRLKDALRARDSAVSWVHDLPMVMLALRTAPRDDNGISPAEMVYGSTLALPSAFINVREPPAADFLQRLRLAAASVPVVPTRSSAVQKAVWIDKALQTCAHVWVRRDGHVKPLEALYDRPFLVLGRSEKVFQLQMGTQMVSVSIDRLKPVHSDGEVTVQQPRCRGRPPKLPLAPPPKSAEQSPPTKKKPGRPPKSTSPPTKRKPGRPPKFGAQTAPVCSVLGGGCAAPVLRNQWTCLHCV